jgi:hypothetical protein
VDANFKLFARFFINVRRPKNAIFLNPRRQGNRAPHLRTGAFRRIDDLARRTIQNTVIEGFQTNAYVLAIYCHFLGPVAKPKTATLG